MTWKGLYLYLQSYQLIFQDDVILSMIAKQMQGIYQSIFYDRWIKFYNISNRIGGAMVSVSKSWVQVPVGSKHNLVIN